MALDTAWWESEERDDPEALSGLKQRFDAANHQGEVRVELDRFFSSLYYDRTYAGFSSGSTMDLLVSNIQDKLNENVIQKIVSAFSAKLARQKPKPVMLTDGADWCLQRKAKKLEKWVWGSLQNARVYEKQRASDLQLILKGTGIIYGGSRRGKFFCEVVPPGEIKVNTAAARYGEPLELYREQSIDRRQLMRLYPSQKDEIGQSAAIDPEDAFLSTGSYDSDMVRVITGWRLPSFEGAGDGGMIMATDKCVLAAREWKRTRFPFAVCRLLLAPEGWFGIGMVQALIGMQLELNRLNVDRQEAVHLLSAPYVAVNRNSRIVASHYSNVIGRMLEYDGPIPPQVITPSPISPALFEHGDRVKSGMFQQASLSEMASQGFKPAGVNSAPALRAYSDMVDDSVHDFFLRREQQILDLADIFIDEAEEMAESGEGAPRSRYHGPRGIQKFDFSDVRMARDDFTLSMKPSSDLSTTLSGKLEDLEELRALGIVTDPAEMQELIQMPDLETAAQRRNSMRDLLLQTIEDEILEDGKAIAPEPTWDLKLAMKLCMATRWRAQMMRNVPEDRIRLLRGFEKNCAYHLLQANGGEPAGAPGIPVEQQPPTPQDIPPEMIPPEEMAAVADPSMAPEVALPPEGAMPVAIE